MSATESRSQVEVIGLTELLSDDFLMLYFENQRRSGGGPIRSYSRKDSAAIITFCNIRDAEAVLSRKEHILPGAMLWVRHPPPWDNRKVALCGLTPDTSETVLELYVENVSGRDSFCVQRSADGAAILVTFREDLTEEEFQQMAAQVAKRPLHQKPISARRMRVSADILVKNIGSHISPDLLEMYFESRRSGGGALQSVTPLRNHSAAIVSFCDWNVAYNVVSRASHSLANCQLSVSSFYPDFLGSPIANTPAELLAENPQQTADTPGELLAEEPRETADTPGELLAENPQETADTTDMEHCAGKVFEFPAVDQEDPNTGGDLKIDGLEKTKFVQGGFNKVQMDEVQQMRPEVQHMKLEVQQMRPEVQQMRPEVQHMKLEVQQMGPEMQKMKSGTSQVGVQSGTLHSPDVDKEESRGSLPTKMFDDEVEGSGEAGLASQSAEVVMEAAELRFIQEHYHEFLAEMDAVTIFPMDEDDKCGFRVAGDSSYCMEAVELLQNILSSLSSRTVTLDYPGVSHFLLESEGQSALHHIEHQHRCVIHTEPLPRISQDCAVTDPWRFGLITPESPPVTGESENVAERISMLTSLLQSLESERKPNNMVMKEVAAGHEDSEADVEKEESSRDVDGATLELKDEELKDEELQQVCEVSLREYQEQQLEEEAQLLLAIQQSMDTRIGSRREEEDEEIQKVLELSLRQASCEDTEESFQRVLELSLQEQCPPRELPAEHSKDSARVRVIALDETSLVVACAALRKAVLAQLNTLSLEVAGNVPHISHIAAALERRHRVQITTSGRQIQIQGFLHGPSQCRQELHQILDPHQAGEWVQPPMMSLDTIQAGERTQPPMMSLDTAQDVDMVDMQEDSEEYKSVLQPFLKTLQDVKLAIDVLQVQKVQNPLLYNQYQLKKQRMAMTDPSKPAERILYHGTSESSAREICHHGFNRSFCGKNAVLYGQGVYFAAGSELSTRDNYSPPNNEGKKFVLVARVLTGEFTAGKADMRTPPLIPNHSGNIPKRYDSLVNNVQKPAIFVIFNDTQAYPEYLITCKNRRDTTR